MFDPLLREACPLETAPRTESWLSGYQDRVSRNSREQNWRGPIFRSPPPPGGGSSRALARRCLPPIPPTQTSLTKYYESYVTDDRFLNFSTALQMLSKRVWF